MRNIKLVIQYDGTNYHGWQIQENDVTIQETVENAIKKLTGVRPKLSGCGRTDTGVHAENYVCSFKTESTISCDRLPYAINRFLPDDIVCTDAEDVSSDFDAQKSAVGKTYTYRILNSQYPDVFFKNGWDSIAFSGIFRAKGNEAGMVYIINAQDCYSSFGELPTVRNRLFTAITRSKAWVRVLGVGEDMKKLEQEFLDVKHNNFQLKFTYPSEELRKKLNIVNRDMSSIEKEKIRNADRTLGELLNNLQDGSININDIDPQKIKLLQNILKEKGIS